MALLTLQSLKDAGAFAGAPVKREIRYHGLDGEEVVADIWVRRASYHTITNTWKAAEGTQEHLAARIATMVCDEEGGPIFSMDDILGTTGIEGRGDMCDTLFLALITAVNEVNSAKTIPQKTSGSN